MLTMFAGLLTSALTAQIPPPVPSDEVRVATSALHTLVIAPDGRVLCQGNNQHAVCGVDPATTPFVEALSPVPGVPKGRAVAVADASTSMVLGEDGRVYVWGRNNFGFLGGTDRGPTSVRKQPTAVAGLDRVVGIAAFDHGGAALRADGTVWMWGEDTEGLLATGTVTLSGQSGKPYYTPRRVAGIDGVTQITGGYTHVLALKSDGTVWGWGANKSAQLGLGDTDRRGVPTKIPSLAGVTRIYASDYLSAARQADGTWVVWGAAPSTQPPTRDVSGGILNDMPPVRTPSPLPGPLRDASDVAVGAVALANGTVRTWGGNSFGTLGTGGSVDAAAPPSRGVLVRSLSGIVRVWSGGNRVLALKSDGTLYYWGTAGTGDGRVLRVPTVMTTFPLSAPRQPQASRRA
jgi:alpha-tubulin suppressor-like RCC1 family protein